MVWILRTWPPVPKLDGNPPKRLEHAFLDHNSGLTVKQLLKSFWAAAAAMVMLLAIHPSAHAGPVFFSTPDCGSSCPTDLEYYGGPVMTGQVNVYVIWYGNWGSNSAQTILPSFFSSWANTSYGNIAMAYGTGAGGNVSTQVTFGGATNTTDYLGDNLSDANVQQIVANAQSSNQLPLDTNGVYFVYTAPGIREEFDNVACGYHSNFGDTKYSWVTSATGCDFLSDGTSTVSGNLRADSLTETSSHELYEALTDPYVNDAPGLASPLAWYDANYGEVGDNCVLSNLATNMHGRQFDVQSIFVKDTSNPQGGFCASGYVPLPSSWTLMLPAFAALYLQRRRTAAASRLG
jgi:hypothetical protein